MTPRYCVLNIDGLIIGIRHRREDADELAAEHSGTVYLSGDGNPAQVQADERFNALPVIAARTAPKEREGGQVMLVMVGASMPSQPLTVDQAQASEPAPLFAINQPQPLQGVLL